MSKSKELSEFDHGSIVGCHLCGKSTREIADILQKPKSTVSDVIGKWKRRGSETAEKRTGRPKILGERSRRTLKRVVKQNRKSSLVEISQEFQSLPGISVSSRTVRRELKNLEFHMVIQPLTIQTSLHRMRSIDCNGVELTIIGLWACGKLFFGVMNLALQSGSQMDASGFGRCPANVPLVAALCRLLSLVVEA
ncbi:regulator of chromosome condensation 2 [Trichonephila clavipes]|uniref:Regulator of chromosome condensation 2 n=1 Tax=Trichonephila clavipes TaxID=2585209 RepID=A0A8X6R1I8_TRICX|nr:regulator of chromosome condensation 2 [Trichonephila clavipes]